MKLIPLKSSQVQSGDDLILKFQEALKLNESKLIEGDILVIASKVLAYSQGLLEKVDNQKEFRSLIKRESDRVLEEGEMILTLKNKVLIPNAGIDNSNTPQGEVVLWPNKPFESANLLRQQLLERSRLSNLGVIISDSHCQPLRMGTSGLAIGWAGFEGVKDERGAKDLFGREMLYTRIAVADNLASAANLIMGETNASIPFVIVRNYAASFTSRTFSETDYFIEPGDCIYRGLYNSKLL